MERIGKLKEFIAVNPNDCFVKHALALEYVKLNNDEEARKLFESILSMDENYIGSYYHLARLFERNDRKEDAIKWYEKGLLKAREVGDQHSYNELLAAYEDLVY